MVNARNISFYHDVHQFDSFIVINPAERNALVGIKPTVGLTSRAGYEIFDGKRWSLLSLFILN